MDSLSFDDIAQGKTVRMVELDNEKYMSETDLVMIMIEKDAHEAAKTIRKFDPADVKELEEFRKEHQFPGFFYLVKRVIEVGPYKPHL